MKYIGLIFFVDVSIADAKAKLKNINYFNN